jgi:hypothetical protein
VECRFPALSESCHAYSSDLSYRCWDRLARASLLSRASVQLGTFPQLVRPFSVCHTEKLTRLWVYVSPSTLAGNAESMLANSFFGNTGLFMTKQYMRDKKWHRNQSKRKDCVKHLRLYRLGKLLRAINGLRGRELDKKSLLKIWGDHGKGDEHRAILLNFFESEFIEEGNRLLPKGASTITSSATQEGSAGLLTSFHCHVQLPAW